MKIQENIPLAAYTTFKIGGPARFFCAVSSEEDLLEVVRFAGEKELPIIVLGGGSNVLVADQGFQGLVIHMEMKGISSAVSRSRESVSPEAAKRRKGETANDRSDTGLLNSCEIDVAAGEILDDFIEYTVSQNLYGLENLSAIPGTVGAAPVQNVSAYGQEIGNVVQSVRVLDTKNMEFVELSNTECAFAYRDSIFKREKGRYIITEVTFQLSRNEKIDIDYKDLKEFFTAGKIAEPTLKQVREAIIEIRSKKLPDWTKFGTAGSYFKNPIIPIAKWRELEKKYPDMPHSVTDDDQVKVNLGWILDKICHVKGLVVGNASTYENQALVVVAKPGATAKEIVNLAQELMKRVKEKTDIDIEVEVEWVC
jgi:UDP-N-acetylmuramate dehydrogenase